MGFIHCRYQTLMLHVDFTKLIRLKTYTATNPVIYLHFLTLPRIILRPSRTDPIQEVLALDSPKYSRSVSSITPKENMVPSRMKLMTKLPRQTNHPQPPSGAAVSVVCCECVLFVSDEFWESFSISINFRTSFMRFRPSSFKKEMNGLFN